MLKYFELLLELLRPEDDDFVSEEKKQLVAAWKKLEERWNRNLEIAHKYWFIFSAYDDLINERISLDEFLATGDITSTRKLDTDKKTSISIISSIVDGTTDDYDNTLFILDSISFLSLADNEKKIVQSWAKSHNCEFVFC